MQEDHVSMGWSAARKLRRSVDGLTRVLAIELLTAARALDLRAPLHPGARPRRGRRRRCARRSRARARTATSSPEIEAAVEFVASGARSPPPSPSPGRWPESVQHVTEAARRTSE